MFLTLLLCALGLFIYLTHKNNQQILRQNEELRRLREENAARVPMPAPPTQQPQIIREVIIEKPVIIVKQVPVNQFPQGILSSGKKFVSVVFKGSGKHYDYLFNDDYDIQVGDYVKVCVHDKNDNNKIKKKIAKVRYISFPGEVSQYARSEIVRKATSYEWRMAS